MDLFSPGAACGEPISNHHCLDMNIHELQLELSRQQAALGQERMAHQRAAQLNAGQSRLLEMIAQGVPLKDTLSELMLLIESQCEAVTCSTVLLDETGTLIRPGAAPNLPEQYTKMLDGIAIGPTAGSCGTAMFLKKQIVVTNMLEDPLWESYRHLIKDFDYVACWSTPILLNKNEVLGAFAMYYRQAQAPDKRDVELIEFATHIAGIAIDRARRETELTKYRENLEDLIRLRTSELTAANEESRQAYQSLNTVNQNLANALNNLSITQQELVQKEKLASLGSLVAGIAHEMNTTVGNCMLAVTTLSDRTRNLAEIYERGLKRSELEAYIKDAIHSIEILVRNLNRTAELVTSFKQVAMDQTSIQRRRFSVEEYISNVLTALQPSIRHSAFVINLNIQKGLMMDSYPGALGQAVTQLINNAMLHGLEARESGVISILAHTIDDQYMEMVISDDGTGMSSETQQHIFEPFFTTRRNLGSTGLGLHMVHNIATGLMGGRIRVQSELEIGTTFYLTLPCTAP